MTLFETNYIGIIEMRLSIISLALSVLMSGCSYEPSKPSNVPAEAFWVGGADGGVFLRCIRIPDESKNYQCAVYNDFNGEVWKEGIFAIKNGNADFNPEDKEMYSGYDRDILLKDSRRLTLIKAFEKANN